MKNILWRESIISVIRSFELIELKNSLCSPQKKNKVRKWSNLFDFEKLCFIWCRHANIDKNKDNLKRVWIVRDTDFVKQLNEMCLAINNSFTRHLKKVLCVNLITVKVLYYTKCYKFDMYYILNSMAAWLHVIYILYNFHI